MGAASQDPGHRAAALLGTGCRARGPGSWALDVGGREGADSWKGSGEVSLGPTSESEVLAGVSGTEESGKL